MPDVPKQDWEVETPLGGRAYRVSPGSGRMEYLKDEQGNYVITPRAPRGEAQEDDRQGFIDQIVEATGTGDGKMQDHYARILTRIRQRPHLMEQAQRYRLTDEDWQAALRDWVGGGGAAMGRAQRSRSPFGPITVRPE